MNRCSFYFEFQDKLIDNVVNNDIFRYIMRNAGLDEAEAGIKISGRNINNLRYADDNTIMAETKEELKFLDERGEQKSWLETQH